MPTGRMRCDAASATSFYTALRGERELFPVSSASTLLLRETWDFARVSPRGLF
jgi:hypothetical protein